MRADAANSDFAISGTVNVTTTGGLSFQTLTLSSSNAGDDCTFQEPCAIYNTAGGFAASSVNCPYSCSVSGGVVGATRNITVIVRDSANVILSTRSTGEVNLNQLSSETGKTADVTDTYLQANSNWTATTVTASTNPTTATWTASTPVSCDECSDGNVTNTATVTSSDAKTATAAFTAPVTCVCSVAVSVSGAGSYSRAWTW